MSTGFRAHECYGRLTSCVLQCRGRSARFILNFQQVLESQLFQKNIFRVLVFVFMPWRLLCECVLRRVTEGEIGLYWAGNKPDTADCRIHKRRRLQYPSTASSHPPYCSFPAPSPSVSRVRLIHLKPTSPPLIRTSASRYSSHSDPPSKSHALCLCGLRQLNS